MKKIERAGISVDSVLLGRFDRLIAEKGYRSRSEAISSLMRKQLNTERWKDPSAKSVAVVSMVYDHHSTRLLERLASVQHNYLMQTICSMHIHLNVHDCMEVVVLKGAVGRINKMADRILSQKGVKRGSVDFITITGRQP